MPEFNDFSRFAQRSTLFCSEIDDTIRVGARVGESHHIYDIANFTELLLLFNCTMALLLNFELLMLLEFFFSA